ncbi:MAG: hypothetical protein GF346_05105 [Candidatus Eisenbacteria bacterium]|nr:hypothetical protein [Candidatus Latescibacterota bacterium]MBD3301804.1 hypothetical protein [Candidatus Eisenbacteria bacterium]
MSLPRPPGRARLHIPVLLTCLSLVIGGSAARSDIRTGNLILADRTSDPFGQGDRRGALFLVDPTSQIPVRLLSTPEGFTDPHAVLPLRDGRILVADAAGEDPGDPATDGVVWIVDPDDGLPGEAVPFASSRQWENPVDLLEEPDGSILLLDNDADPLNTGTRPGAIFRIDPTTREVTALASNPEWVHPSSMVFDVDGAVLVWDPRSDPNGLGTLPGALFRVDRDSGIVELVFSIEGFETPSAVEIGPDGDYLVVDRDANPAGHEGRPGGVFLVARGDLAITPVVFPPDFEDPIDLLVDPSGDLWVLDARANPLDFANARGAVFRCDPNTGEVVRRIGSGFFRSLNGITQVAGTALDSSRVSWVDLSGPPVEPGDRMEVVVTPWNTGTVPGRPVTMRHELGGSWDYLIGSDSSSAGEVRYDPQSRTVIWTGDLEIQEQEEIRYEIRLGDDVADGAILTEEIDLSVSRTRSTFELQAEVSDRFSPTRFVWADYSPSTPVNQGRILEKVGPGAPTALYEGAPLVQPDDVVVLPDGRLAVLDRRSRPLGPEGPAGGIYAIAPFDGTIDTLLAVGDHPELRFPVGLGAAEPGTLLLVDKDANPLDLPGLPGAVFLFDLETGALDLVASDARFSEPSDAILETTGKILMVDYDADPSGTNFRGGAVFEIDRTTGAVTALPDPNGRFVDPIGIAEGFEGRIYVADLSADPLGLGGNTGAIFEFVRPLDDLLLLTSADSVYVDPTDLFLREDGTLIVTDREANPFELPPRDRGAVFRLRPRVERPQVVTADPSMYGPEAVAGRTRGDLSRSALETEEVGDPPTGAGDTLRFVASIENSGRADVSQVLGTVTTGPGLQLIGAEGPGDVRVDPGAGAASWIGSIPASGNVVFSAYARVEEGLEFGDRVFALLDVSGPGAGPPDSGVARVVGPLASGDLVLIDSNADPDNLGEGDGALYLLDAREARAKHLLLTDSLWVEPVAIEPWKDGSFLVADTRGDEPGIIHRADYLNGRVEPYVEDARLGAPIDLFTNLDGDLFIVDPYARIDPEGPPKAVVFVQRGEGEPLSVLSEDPLLVEPNQIAADAAGRLWLIDRRADPNGTAPGRGALYRLDPETGALVDTLQFPELLSPSSIVPLVQHGLVIVDQLTRAAGSRGALFLYDPDRDTLAVAAADPRFRLPHRAEATPSGEVWITDRLARDETVPGSPRTLFRWNPATGAVDAVAAHSGYVTPMEVVALPGPNPILSRYELEDLDGPPLDPGDPVILRARIGNVGPLATHGAVFSDTLPISIRLDRESVRADAGIIELPLGLNGLRWIVDLPSGSEYEIAYGGNVHNGAQQGGQIHLSAHLDTAEGVRRSEAIERRLPVYVEDGFLYVADPDADPFDLGRDPGTLWKVHLSSGFTYPMVRSTQLVSPTDALVMPTTEPTVLIVDSGSSLGEHPLARGAVWRCIPVTGGVELIAADSTFRSPRAAVATSSSEILLVDAWADPFDLRRGLGPGAVYRVDVTTGDVEPILSDSLLVSPVALVLDGEGGAYVIDADADPMGYGLRNGAVFHFDLETGDLSLFAADADFREPVAGVLDPEGVLHVVDRDVRLNANSEARGAVYRLDALGNVSVEAVSESFRKPVGIAFDHQGRLIVSDADADPRERGTDTGTIFRRERLETDFRILSAYGSFVDPAGFFVRDDLTAIDLAGLQAVEGEGEIRIEWEAVAASFDRFYCLRADGSDPDPSAYRILNREDPIPGRGPWVYHDREVEPRAVYSYQILGYLSGGGERRYGPVTAVAPDRIPFALLPPAPHPVRGQTSLRFDLPSAGPVRLEIYELSGRRVRRFQWESLPAGRSLVLWDGTNQSGHPAASGIYWMRLDWAGRQATRRLVLLR